MNEYTMKWNNRNLIITCNGNSVEKINEVGYLVENTVPEHIERKVMNFLEWWMG